MNGAPIRLLIVDDQALVRAGFSMILGADDGIEVVGEAGDGAEAISMTRRLQPDIVLMDIRMPVMDGIEATRHITAAGGHARVVVLTTFDLDDYVYEALRAGASGFLLKDVIPGELAAAIRIVAAGDAILAPSVTRKLIEEYASRPSGQVDTSSLEHLTEREVEVLQEIAKGSSNSEVADALFVSETTVKTHVSHILTKLELRDRVQAVVFAYESGLVAPGG